MVDNGSESVKLDPPMLVPSSALNCLVGGWMNERK